MKWTDTHVHLLSYLESGQWPVVLKRAIDMGVHRMIAVGTGRDSDAITYQKLATDFSNCLDYTIGLHPAYVDENWRSALPDFKGILTDNFFKKPIGIGEIGLDYFHLSEDPEVREKLIDYQKEAFCEQLRIAKNWQLPVIIHSRGAFDDCLSLLDSSGLDLKRVVFHCFVEGVSQMHQLLERGIWASFTGIVSYKNATTVREALKAMPAERLMLETDSPYLAPVPYRGKANEPAYVVHVAEACSAVLAIPLSELSRLTELAVDHFWYPQSSK